MSKDYMPIPCPTDCDYVPPSIKKIKVKKDKHGNWLVQINGKGKWLGATINKDTKTISFSY